MKRPGRAAGAPRSEGLQTFSTNLKIKAGDLIGIDPTNATRRNRRRRDVRCQLRVDLPDAVRRLGRRAERNRQRQRDRAQRRSPAGAGNRLDRPAFGPVTGGTVLTITGKNFTNASAVEFGSTPAASFTVDSDTQITATAPGVLRPGKVDSAITTVAGENPNTRFDDYVYRACVVPAIKGKSLKKAKTLLRRSGCKLGHVKKVNAPAKKVGKVLKQTPRPGKVLAPGARVRVNLGK